MARPAELVNIMDAIHFEECTEAVLFCQVMNTITVPLYPWIIMVAWTDKREEDIKTYTHRFRDQKGEA